jgi:hypothetical protein
MPCAPPRGGHSSTEHGGPQRRPPRARCAQAHRESSANPGPRGPRAYAGGLVVVFGRCEVFSPGKLADELGGVVDEDRQVLRAHPEPRPAVLQTQQRGLQRPTLTEQARFLATNSRHDRSRFGVTRSCVGARAHGAHPAPEDRRHGDPTGSRATAGALLGSRPWQRYRLSWNNALTRPQVISSVGMGEAAEISTTRSWKSLSVQPGA